MSGIGSSLADLDKGVRKSVPGGWGTVAGLAAGGAGLYYGAGAGAAGAANAGGSIGGISTGGAFVPTAGSGASFALPGAASASGATAAMQTAKNTADIFGAPQPFMAKVIQTGGNLGAEQAAMIAQFNGNMGLEGAAHAIGSSYQPGTLGSGVARAMYGGAGITPTQALMANQAMGGFGQQQPQGGQQTSIGMRQGQPVNTADPIAALLAPKRKKKEPISLL